MRVPFNPRSLLLAVLLLAPGAGLAAQSLPACVRPEFAAAPRLGDLDPSTSLHLSLELPLRDPAGADAYADAVGDPRSPDYRRYLTPERFADRFGPTAADYQALEDFARSQGLDLVALHRNRMVLEVRGSAAAVERAFHVSLGRRRRADGSVFYAPDSVPSVDLDLPHLEVHGLDDFPRWRRHARRHAPDASRDIHRPDAGGQNGSGPGGAYQGYDFRYAYAPSVSLEGEGQSIGLVEFGGYYPEDISAYASSSDPALPSDFTVSPVLIGGYNGNPMDNGDTFTDGPADDNSEVSLDIELSLAMAPQAVIVPFEADFNTDMGTELAGVADDTACAQVSCSWYGGDMGNAAAELVEMVDQGQAFFQAAGDNGAYSYDASGQNLTGPVPEPQSLTQCVTVVGGTQLFTNAGHGGGGLTYASETTWNDFEGSCADVGDGCDDCVGGAGGGGICDVSSDCWGSNSLGIPSWQAGASIEWTTNGGSSTFRNVPDVSAVAYDFQVVYCGGCTAQEDGGYSGQQSFPFDGTSGATPLWAGFLALVNQQIASEGLGGLGFANPALYSLGQGQGYDTEFHDIADGSNNDLVADKESTYNPPQGACDTESQTYPNGSSCGQVYFTAVTGYDLCTGWGSPQGQALIAALAGTLATPTPTSTRTATPSITPTPSATQTFTDSPTATDTLTITPTPTATPTLTDSPTATDTPTATPTPTITQTFTDSPTATATPTITQTFTWSPTPSYLNSGLGRVVLVPDPVRGGGPAVLYFTQRPVSSRWWVYTLSGRLALTAAVSGPGPHQVSTASLASGVYFARVQVAYADGQSQTLWLKFAELR